MKIPHLHVDAFLPPAKHRVQCSCDEKETAQTLDIEFLVQCEKLLRGMWDLNIVKVEQL